jgi:hypothetical protein
MTSDLLTTGTAALLELLDPFVPDDFINECWPHWRAASCAHGRPTVPPASVDAAFPGAFGEPAGQYAARATGVAKVRFILHPGYRRCQSG